MQFLNLANSSDLKKISNEFRYVPDLSKKLKEKLSTLDFESFWFEIKQLKNSENNCLFPYLSKFVANILCFSHSSNNGVVISRRTFCMLLFPPAAPCLARERLRGCPRLPQPAWPRRQ